MEVGEELGRGTRGGERKIAANELAQEGSEQGRTPPPGRGGKSPPEQSCRSSAARAEERQGDVAAVKTIGGARPFPPSIAVNAAG